MVVPQRPRNRWYHPLTATEAVAKGIEVHGFGRRAALEIL
jgi:hypothetical protein